MDKHYYEHIDHIDHIDHMVPGSGVGTIKCTDCHQVWTSSEVHIDILKLLVNLERRINDIEKTLLRSTTRPMDI